MNTAWKRGSEWHRWDPHLHTPGTALNDQFGRDWTRYLDVIESARPTVEALGVTDYCTISGYKEFLKHRASGRASNVTFAFPNVEFRLEVQTEKKRGINLHLLFSPEDRNHVREIERLLGELKFEYKARSYGCTPQELAEFGRAIDPKQSDETGALKAGVEQFKLDFKQLKRLFADDRWMRENCLVAVEAGETDGTAGLQKDGAFKALREELCAAYPTVGSRMSASRTSAAGSSPPTTSVLRTAFGTTGRRSPHCLRACAASCFSCSTSPSTSGTYVR